MIAGVFKVAGADGPDDPACGGIGRGEDFGSDKKFGKPGVAGITGKMDDAEREGRVGGDDAGSQVAIERKLQILPGWARGERAFVVEVVIRSEVGEFASNLVGIVGFLC